jgi:hypothetical protein
MSLLRNPLFALALATLLGGCATPRYEIAYRLEPPEDASGRACVSRCLDPLQACQDSCRGRYQACQREIEPLLNDAYAEALRRYAFDLDSYAASLQHYEMQLWLGWGHAGWWGYPGWYGPGWFYPYPAPPPPPRPSRERVWDRLVAEKCDPGCGCQAAYDGCFVACGGKRIPEQRCVANCPAE